MKKRFTILATAALAAILLALAPSPVAPQALADDHDTAAVTAATNAIDELGSFMDDAPTSPDKEFYARFIDQADKTKQKISRAYADLGYTTETGEIAGYIQAMRSDLADMKTELSTWRDAAVAGDDEAFNSAAQDFGDTVSSYNESVDAYNSAASRSGAADSLAAIVLVLLVIALPVVLIVRNQKLKKIQATQSQQHAPGANAPLIVSPRKFLLLSLATLNLYQLYWGWQAWEIVGKAEDKKYHSTFRSWFLVFTSFSLFEKTKKLATDTGYKKSFNDSLLATGVLAVAIVIGTCWRISNNIFVLITALIIEAVCMTLLVRPVLAAQAHYLQHTTKQVRPLSKDLWTLTAMMIAGALTIIALISVAFAA